MIDNAQVSKKILKMGSHLKSQNGRGVSELKLKSIFTINERGFFGYEYEGKFVV